jgi:hypothetical protein
MAFHIALAPAGLPLALPVLTLELVLAWSYREAFSLVLAALVDATRCRPTVRAW